ncbi:zinc transporter 1 [Adelges cooleyi]|uniref:zinc transporter 1 n=1 Tax=Adelges cooleyi TaxID=133065 RepID=UPI00217F7D9F|nr:zinc transporter 1 [Adelges cooleyi]XP_050443617.1 zinc transporter 1 [Adelges cooleyi]
MSAKQILRSFNPIQVYLVIFLTLSYFLIQLIFSHITHALTLLVDSYHVLCKLIYLFGSIICVKHNDDDEICLNEECQEKAVSGEEVQMLELEFNKASSTCTHPHLERKLKNTFGWARIEVVVMLCGCVFLASLSFSLVVEAVQTLIHIDHQDPIHQPFSVFIIGMAGFVIHGLCYLLLGGNQTNITPQNGIGVVDKGEAVPLSSSQLMKQKIQTRNCSFREISRDIVGCTMVMICSVIVNFTDPQIGKYVDPGLSIVSAVLLLYLKFPSMKESCLILLQTIPDHMNIDMICKELMLSFPDIVNVHELHIWQLTEHKIISTAHIIFLNPKDYLRINKAVINFFRDNGIGEVTIQPEFFKDDQNIQMIPEYGMGQCLVQCNQVECLERNCCEPNELNEFPTNVTTSNLRDVCCKHSGTNISQMSDTNVMV